MRTSRPYLGAAVAVVAASLVAWWPAPAASAAGDPIADIPVQEGSPWPQMRRDRRNTARSPIVGRYRGGKPWSFTTGKGIFSTPVIGADGTTYVGSADSNLYALSPRGRERWRYRTGNIIDAGGVLMEAGPGEGSLVFGSGDETLYRVSLEPGVSEAERTIWEYRTKLQPATGQLVNWWEGPLSLAPDGDVLAGNTGGGVFRIREDGSERWVVERGNSVWTAPATADDGTTYWGSLDRSLFALGPDGEVKWDFPTLGFVTSSPAIGSDGTVYAASFDGKVYALDPATGVPRWSHQTRDHVYGGPALAADGDGRTTRVVIGSADGEVYSFDPATGAVQWSYDTGDPVRSSPAIGVGADGGEVVYVGAGNGRLYALDAETGRRRWSFDTTPGDPVLQDRNDLNASPALGRKGVVIGGEHGRVWHVPYDWCLERPRDRRCETGPEEEFADDLNGVAYTSPGGTTTLAGPRRPLPPASSLAARLVVREGGATVDANAVAVPDAESLVSPAPAYPYTAETSGDGSYVFVVPDGFLAPRTDYSVRVAGTYTADGIPVGNTTVGGTRSGEFDGTVGFRTAGLGREPRLRLGRDEVSALEIRRLAVPLPSFLPSVNQIGFDSYDLIAGLVSRSGRDAAGERRVLLWVIGGRRTASGKLVPDPKAGFAFPLPGRLKGSNFILRNDKLDLTFSFGEVPFRRFELRGALDRRLRAKPGASMYAEVECAEVPNYSVALYVTGICNTAGRLAASGTYLTDGYDSRGGANVRPRGVSAGPVFVAGPGGASDGEARVEIEVAEGVRYTPRRHQISILLFDAATGTPVPVNYAKDTEITAGPDGNIAEVRVRIPTGTELPANLEAAVMADAFPLSGPAPVEPR